MSPMAQRHSVHVSARQGMGRNTWNRKVGRELGELRRHTAPELSDVDLLLLGMDVAPKRLTQSHLAVLCGVSARTIHNAEQGRGVDAYVLTCMRWHLTPRAARKGTQP